MMVERSRFVAVSVLVAALVCYSDGQGLRQRVGDVTPSLVSKPGGAGHALMFRDQVLVKKDFKNFPSKALTFEAWISTSDFCHAGTIMSYSIDSHATDTDQRVADFNHFVIFDPRNVLACHDYTYIDLKPDYSNVSCHAGFRNVSRLDNTAKMTERDGQWHHLAVTWSVENEGLTEIFMDGLRVASSYSRKTKPLQPGGAFMIGGEQDCFGGCTDPTQGFYGFIDEVRLWSVVRSQEDILKHMRWASGLENHNDLAAYWKFNDPDTDNGQFRRHSVAKDSSGKGNDISLIQPPFRNDVTIQQGSSSLHTGTLLFQNNLALNRAAKNMPDGSFTVEFWARGPKIADADDTQEKYSQVFSYATQRKDGDRTVGPDFMDDAIRIERYLEDFGDRLGGHQSTRGAISVHINSNENTDSHRAQNWIDFDANWVDASWHHIAVTWEFDSGATKVYIDGEAKTPFWRSEHGMVEDKPAREGGVDMHLVAKTTRSAEGSLVLGQDQDCFGGCFSPSNAYNGDLAVVRIWNRARSQDDIRRNMWRERPDNEDGLSALYIFSADGLAVSDTGDAVALDRSPSKNNLQLRSNPPQWVYSYAPLVSPEGLPVAPPMPGAAGFALALHDKQVLMLPNFQDFPSDAITVEFWMQSVDTCRPGVPFSYAHGKYEKEDNSFLIFNYNSFGVSVMEDEGTLVDHLSGVSATDGNWHHIAVTWTSSTGETILYDNGYPRWKVTRSRGAKIPSGGTLVIGREQDCQGGCFDSATGASGKVSEVSDQEYGPQDFFGLIEEMRIWKVVRTPDQIKAGMRADDGRAASGFNKPGVDKDDTNLVAYWKFDEGAGYTVHDVTGHGHDLIMAEPPTWSVVRWLSSCGNAAVEGSEECDDGDNSGGDGCSPSCTIEDGWECEGSPSICRHTGAPPRPRPPVPGPTPTPQPSGGGEHGPTPSPGGGSGSSKSHGGAIAAAVLVPVFVLIFAGAAFAYRHVIYEQFPQVESAVDSAARGIGRLMPGGDKSSDRYAHLALDPEEVDMSPEFLAPTPSRAPGYPGPYQPFPDPSQRPASH